MRHREIRSPVEWATRVNRAWIVRSNLNDQAGAWLDYLARLEDGRLQKSCEIARSMCDLRPPEADPKPWFYAGLFQLASEAEVNTFIDTHRVTKATVPVMVNDSDVLLWLERVGPETLKLLDRLRDDLARCR